MSLGQANAADIALLPEIEARGLILTVTRAMQDKWSSKLQDPRSSGIFWEDDAPSRLSAGLKVQQTAINSYYWMHFYGDPDWMRPEVVLREIEKHKLFWSISQTERVERNKTKARVWGRGVEYTHTEVEGEPWPSLALAFCRAKNFLSRADRFDFGGDESVIDYLTLFRPDLLAKAQEIREAQEQAEF